MRSHTSFILNPITDILREAAFVSSQCKMAMHEQPLSDYVMQSIFLKMTGFQEQKLKCINWVLATEDYDYRYKFLKDGKKNTSAYDDKNDVLIQLVEAIKSYDSTFQGLDITICDSIIVDAKREISDFFEYSHLCSWLQHDYADFVTLVENVTGGCLFLKNKEKITQFFNTCNNCSVKLKRDICKMRIVNGSLRSAYEAMYKYRNECAHNISSYKQDLPSLKILANHTYVYENYFLRFFLLILIDSMAMKLYAIFSDKSGLAYDFNNIH